MIVVGAGVMGSSVALELARRGLAVTVLERSVPGAEASSAAAGILGPAIEAHAPGPGLRLGLASLALHAELSERILAEHGVDVGFRRSGVLRAAFGAVEGAELDAHAAFLAEAGVAAERIDGDEARRREPSLSHEVAGALDLPEEAQVDPRALLRGLAIAAGRAGAVYRSGATVREVVVKGERVRGVRVEEGLLACGAVVVAAGSWTTLVPGLRLPADAIFPVRGQIVACETRPPVFRRVIFGAGGYVLCRPDGRVLAGSTMERVGFAREVTLGGLAKIVGTACRLAPSLADAPIGGYWSSFRPGTRDELPLVGPAGADGLYLASGHYRNGILLAPITGALVADCITGRPPHPELAALAPTRFGLAEDP